MYNKSSLTQKECEIVDLLIQGFTNKEIAEKLSISFLTVKAHLEDIYERFGVHNRVELCVRILLHK